MLSLLSTYPIARALWFIGCRFLCSCGTTAKHHTPCFERFSFICNTSCSFWVV